MANRVFAVPSNSCEYDAPNINDYYRDALLAICAQPTELDRAPFPGPEAG
jgi:hypothetical protein